MKEQEMNPMIFKPKLLSISSEFKHSPDMGKLIVLVLFILYLWCEALSHHQLCAKIPIN
jgi:hypothetical protein